MCICYNFYSCYSKVLHIQLTISSCILFLLTLFLSPLSPHPHSLSSPSLSLSLIKPPWWRCGQLAWVSLVGGAYGFNVVDVPNQGGGAHGFEIADVAYRGGVDRWVVLVVGHFWLGWIGGWWFLVFGSVVGFYFRWLWLLWVASSVVGGAAVVGWWVWPRWWCEGGD